MLGMGDLMERGLQVVPDPEMLSAEGYFGGGSFLRDIPFIGKLQEGFSSWLFRDYIPRLKMAMAMDAFGRNTKRYSSKLSPGQIADLTARQSDAAFGELNLDWMGRNKTFQATVRALAIAPDFLEARARFALQATKGLGQEQFMALARLALTQYVASRILNKLIDDDYHWDKPFSVIYNGREYNLRTVPADVYELITDPNRFAYNRLSPAGRMAVEGITGRNYKGEKITAQDWIQDALTQPIPMSLRTKIGDQNLWTSVLNSSGLRNKPYTESQEIHSLAASFLREKKGPPTVEIIGEGPFAQLKQAMMYGQDKRAAGEVDRLIASGRKPYKILRAYREYAFSPFTNKTLEREFVSTLTPRQKQMYDNARQKKRADFMRLRQIMTQYRTVKQ